MEEEKERKQTHSPSGQILQVDKIMGREGAVAGCTGNCKIGRGEGEEEEKVLSLVGFYTLYRGGKCGGHWRDWLGSQS